MRAAAKVSNGILWLDDILYNPNYPKCQSLDVWFGQPWKNELNLISLLLHNPYNKNYKNVWKKALNICEVLRCHCVVNCWKERPYKTILTLKQGLPLVDKHYIAYDQWSKSKILSECSVKNTWVLWHNVIMKLSFIAFVDKGAKLGFAGWL